MKFAKWILTSPDNETYDRDYAWESIEHLAKKLGLEFETGDETRDTGFGQEELFIFEGDEKAEESFDQLVGDYLY